MAVRAAVPRRSWSERGAKTGKMQQALAGALGIAEDTDLNLAVCGEEGSLNSSSCLPLQNQRQTGFKPGVEVSFLSLMIRLNLQIIVFPNHCHVASHRLNQCDTW